MIPQKESLFTATTVFNMQINGKVWISYFSTIPNENAKQQLHCRKLN